MANVDVTLTTRSMSNVVRLHHLTALMKEAAANGAPTTALVKAEDGKVSILWTKE